MAHSILFEGSPFNEFCATNDASYGVTACVDDGPAPLRNQRGEAMGSKGQRTRLRLMDATERLLADRPISSLRTADIAAAAGTSTAAFYRYFSDAADAALAVVKQCNQSTGSLLILAGQDWPADKAGPQALAFVTAYVETWSRHADVLRMRNLAAESGDSRFWEAREDGVRPLQNVLAGRLRRAQSNGRLPRQLNAAATAGALIALLERISAVSRVPSAQSEITHQTLVEAVAFIISRTIPSGA